MTFEISREDWEADRQEVFQALQAGQIDDVEAYELLAEIGDPPEDLEEQLEDVAESQDDEEEEEEPEEEPELSDFFERYVDDSDCPVARTDFTQPVEAENFCLDDHGARVLWWTIRGGDLLIFRCPSGGKEEPASELFL